MAKPIALDVTPRDPRAELRRRLDEAPEEHAEAILELYRLLDELHESGILRLLRGAVASSDTILEAAVGAANSADGIRAMRNGIILLKLLGSIDPNLVQAYASAATETLHSQHAVADPPGLFTLLSEFRQPELRRSIMLVNRFLEMLGPRLKSAAPAAD